MNTNRQAGEDACGGRGEVGAQGQWVGSLETNEAGSGQWRWRRRMTGRGW